MLPRPLSKQVPRGPSVRFRVLAPTRDSHRPMTASVSSRRSFVRDRQVDFRDAAIHQRSPCCRGTRRIARESRTSGDAARRRNARDDEMLDELGPWWAVKGCGRGGRSREWAPNRLRASRRRVTARVRPRRRGGRPRVAATDRRSLRSSPRVAAWDEPGADRGRDRPQALAQGHADGPVAMAEADQRPGCRTSRPLPC